MTWTSIYRGKHLEPPPWLYGLMARGAIMRLVYRRLVADLAVHLPPGARVLDVGAGPGFVLAYLAQVRPDLQLWGLDSSPAMISRARQRPGPLYWVVADARALPFLSRTFDFALASFSCHIWPHPAQGLTEMLQVLKPGGRAWIYELRREAPLADLRAFAREARLPFPLVFLGFKTASRHHSIPEGQFTSLLTQAAGPHWRLQPRHHLFWRAELARA